uniref:Uncharacterized protein n=1 Tax=Acrobeloides nanus TaxID=290746 RepID=A0A914ERV9_9BILA
MFYLLIFTIFVILNSLEGVLANDQQCNAAFIQEKCQKFFKCNGSCLKNETTGETTHVCINCPAFEECKKDPEKCPNPPKSESEQTKKPYKSKIQISSFLKAEGEKNNCSINGNKHNCGWIGCCRTSVEMDCFPGLQSCCRCNEVDNEKSFGLHPCNGCCRWGPFVDCN